MSNEAERIANRHVARCLSKIEEVHDLPDLCANVVRQEMHYCAQDVTEALKQHGVSEDDTRGNR